MLKTRLVLLLILGLLLPHMANAELYRWVDEHGTMHFTDSPPEHVKAKKLNLQINSYQSPKVAPFSFNQSLISKRKSSTDVIMYSTTWCGYCKQARRYFTRQGIAFEEYDVEKSAKGKQDYRKLNGRGVPIILVGDRRMNGFSPQQFNRLYAP